MISMSLSSSMRSWANARARRAGPVGRLAIAAWECRAVSTFWRAASSRRGRSLSPAADRMPSTRSATARRAFAAWWCVVTRSNSGQSATPAPVEINPAMAQPPTRAGLTSADPGMVTAITKARSIPMFAAATYPPKMRMNEIAKPTRSITTAASQADDETSVPSATSAAPTIVAMRYAIARGRRRPPKSEITSREKKPNITKIRLCGSPRSSLANAKPSGMTMAARVARRRAPKPGSRGTFTATRNLRLRACGLITSSMRAFDQEAGIPRAQAGAGRVGALEKPEDCFLGRCARANVVVQERKLAELRGPARLRRLDDLLLESTRFGVRVREEGGLWKLGVSRPEPGADLLGVAPFSLDEPGARSWLGRTAREPGVGEVERAPEEMHRRRPPAKSRTMVLEHQVNPRQHSPETICPFRLVRRVNGVLGKGNRIADLGGNRADAGVDPQRAQVGHEIGMKVSNRARAKRDLSRVASHGLDYNMVVDEVDVDLEYQPRVRHRGGRQSARAEVQRHVGPLSFERAQSEPDFAHDLQVHVQRLERVFPGAVGQLRPDLAGRIAIHRPRGSSALLIG